jgi:hypothetical protein
VLTNGIKIENIGSRWAKGAWKVNALLKLLKDRVPKSFGKLLSCKRIKASYFQR